MKKKRLYAILILFFAGIFAIGVFQVYRQLSEYKEGDSSYSQLTIYVEDPVSIQNVYDKISALPELKGKTLKLSIDTEEYDVVSTPLESLQKLVNTTIVIISVVSVVILTLLLTIWIRGRKKEIGILLSIGKSKANIILQIFTETFVVAVVAFAASIPFSFFVAEKAGVFLVSRVTTGTANLNVQIDAAYLLPLYRSKNSLLAKLTQSLRGSPYLADLPLHISCGRLIRYRFYPVVRAYKYLRILEFFRVFLCEIRRQAHKLLRRNGSVADEKISCHNLDHFPFFHIAAFDFPSQSAVPVQ